MEEKKSSKGILVVLVIILLVAFFAVGFLFGKKAVNNDTKKDADTKQEEKKEEKVTEKKKHEGCAVCDETGGICCPTDPDKTHERNYLEVPDSDDTYKTEIKLYNGDYEYNIKVTNGGGTFKIEANGKVILEKAYVLDNVFVMDNGMLGVEYHWDLDQALRKQRTYFDKNLKLVKTIEGIKDVDLFATEYEYTVNGNVCLKDNGEEYNELKLYKAVIGSDSIETELVKTEKIPGCAGITG